MLQCLLVVLLDDLYPCPIAKLTLKLLERVARVSPVVKLRWVGRASLSPSVLHDDGTCCNFHMFLYVEVAVLADTLTSVLLELALKEARAFGLLVLCTRGGNGGELGFSDLSKRCFGVVFNFTFSIFSSVLNQLLGFSVQRW